MKSSSLDFWEKYGLINSSNSYSLAGVKSNICRYCGKTASEVTFEQKTHLLPELIGENEILTFDECDVCNNLFSGYESNFSVFVRPYVTLFGVKGKKKVPAFQSRTIDRNEETRTLLRHKQGNQKEMYIRSLSDYTINSDSNTVELLFRKPPFVPLKVYKTLLKIGLSLLPSELDIFNRQSFAWLTNRQEELNFISQAFVTTLKRKRFAQSFACLYKANKLFDNTNEFPEYILILCFVNQIIQIFLPFSDELKQVHNDDKQLVLNLFPAFAFDEVYASQVVKINSFNLGIDYSITEDEKMLFEYGEAEINIPSKEG